MGWLRLTINSDASHVDDIGTLLEQFGAVSLSYTPVTDEPLFDEGEQGGKFWSKTAVSALLDEDVDLDILMACIRIRIGTEQWRCPGRTASGTRGCGRCRFRC